jgi:hypothetical protein
LKKITIFAGKLKQKTYEPKSKKIIPSYRVCGHFSSDEHSRVA